MSIANIEKKAVLELTKHFINDSWLAVDVGANKGQWSDILIEERDSSVHDGKYTIYMVEPNDALVTYMSIKYEYNDHLKIVRDCAITDHNGTVDFWYWENRHNGLSSTLDNSAWHNLPDRKHKIAKAYTLDEFYSRYMRPYIIDIAKIDIEGAEWFALQGMKKVLSEKLVTFIQIEYSEHYKLSGHTFKDVIEFAAQYGYFAWEYDGEFFRKMNAEAFNENYELTNFFLSYKEIGEYDYTENWSEEFKRNTEYLKGKVSFALEIGAFEGRTSNYICDTLLRQNAPSRMICIDPLVDGKYYHDAPTEHDKFFVGQYERFMNNTKRNRDAGKIELIRDYSDYAFKTMPSNYRFDLILIDGDHREDAVYRDAEHSLGFLKRGGVIVFDDYNWSEETRRGIDKFLKDAADVIQIVTMSENQVLIQKIK